MKRKDTKAILQQLLRTHSKAVDLEFELLLQGKTAEADDVLNANNDLNHEINRLRKKSWKEWTGSAAAIQAEIVAANNGLQGAIRDIEKKIKVAQRVVKAIGYIDDVAARAAKIAV